MNHQPFENWLLSEETLAPEDAQALAEHLETCDHCREFQESWLGVVDLFQEVPELEPAPGFVNRFQERLALEKQVEASARNRWQSMILLVLIGNIIAGLVVLLATQFLSTYQSPLAWFLSGVYRLASIVATVNVYQNILFTLIRNITSVVPAGIWATLAIGLVGSVATWVISLTSLSVLHRRT
jgi:hypothetical protein